MSDEVADACEGCGAVLTWIDLAHLCPQGCTWCSDCADMNAGLCASCSEPLRRVRRTRAIG